MTRVVRVTAILLILSWGNMYLHNPNAPLCGQKGKNNSQNCSDRPSSKWFTLCDTALTEQGNTWHSLGKQAEHWSKTPTQSEMVLEGAIQITDDSLSRSCPFISEERHSGEVPSPISPCSGSANSHLDGSAEDKHSISNRFHWKGQISCWWRKVLLTVHGLSVTQSRPSLKF